MGIVLMGGTVVLAGLVWKKVSADTSGAPAAHGCAGGAADLKGRGSVIASQIDGSKLRVTLQQAGGLEVVTLDMCSGKEASAVRVQADSVRIRN